MPWSSVRLISWILQWLPCNVSYTIFFPSQWFFFHINLKYFPVNQKKTSSVKLCPCDNTKTIWHIQNNSKSEFSYCKLTRKNLTIRFRFKIQEYVLHRWFFTNCHQNVDNKLLHSTHQILFCFSSNLCVTLLQLGGWTNVNQSMQQMAEIILRSFFLRPFSNRWDFSKRVSPNYESL